jgi:hypothetical protein
MTGLLAPGPTRAKADELRKQKGSRGLLGAVGEPLSYAPNPVVAMLGQGLLGARYLTGEKEMGEGLASLSDMTAMAVGSMLPPGLRQGVLMAAGHAKKGGEIGKNNEMYKGGQFLPSSAATEKGKMQFPKGQRAGGKAEIAPGEWANRPVDGAKPLKNLAEYDWQAFRQTGELRPFDGFYRNAPQYLPEARLHAEAFNRGARWVTPDGQFLDATGRMIAPL